MRTAAALVVCFASARALDGVLCGNSTAVWNPRIDSGSFSGAPNNWIPRGGPSAETAVLIDGTIGATHFGTSTSVTVSGDAVVRGLVLSGAELVIEGDTELTFPATAATEMELCDGVTLEMLSPSRRGVLTW